MSIVNCKLPKAGLGNQLFPLMKAYLFGQINNLGVIVTGYNQFRIGPYLRGDKSKRNYRKYFIFQKGILREQLDRLALLKYRHYQKQEEHSIEKITGDKKNKQYIFRDIPHWSDYFKELKDNREEVIRLFWSILSPDFKLQLEKQAAPWIGVHIRRGDYRKLKEGEDFSKVGIVRTPEEYFTNTIKSIRKVAGKDLPVSIFTDGYKDEFDQLFSVGNIKIVEGNQDIVDLLLLSKSKIIITSAGSTFSSWAGFLSNAPLIMHPNHIHQTIRPICMGLKIYEGKFNPANPVLLNNIQNML